MSTTDYMRQHSVPIAENKLAEMVVYLIHIGRTFTCTPSANGEWLVCFGQSEDEDIAAPVGTEVHEGRSS